MQLCHTILISAILIVNGSSKLHSGWFSKWFYKVNWGGTWEGFGLFDLYYHVAIEEQSNEHCRSISVLCRLSIVVKREEKGCPVKSSNHGVCFRKIETDFIIIWIDSSC